MEEAEGKIERYKGKVSECESKAAGCEERLGLLEKEGECRTLLLTCDCVNQFKRNQIQCMIQFNARN